MTTSYILIKEKRCSYILTPVGKKFTHVVCKEAAIDQEFSNEDIPELLALLPKHILEEQKYRTKQDAVLRFRVSGKEKVAIEKKAGKAGFKNVSSYLRKVALTN